MPYRSVLLALFGTFIEYYDYALFGFFAPIFAKHFFSECQQNQALFYTYGIFIASSCAKPFGSLLFGRLSDSLGRAKSLKISMAGIAIPTFIIGILPDFQSIGYWAPALLLFCKLLQGLFVAGESDTVRVYLFEIGPKNSPCFLSSLSYFVCLTGIYTASIMMSLHLNQQIENWRLPFIIGGIFGLFIFLIRRKLSEATPSLRGEAEAIQKKINLFSNKKNLILTLLLTGSIGGQYHFYFIFLNQYLSNTLQQFDPATASQINSNLLLLFSIFLPIGGWLADRFQIRRFLNWAFLYVFLMVFLLILFFHQLSILKPLLYFTSIGLALIHSCTFVLLFDLFQPQERCTLLSLGHSLGSMIFSGTAPFISLWIWQKTNVSVFPLYYFLMLCFISYFVFFLTQPVLKERQNRPILESWIYFVSSKFKTLRSKEH